MLVVDAPLDIIVSRHIVVIGGGFSIVALYAPLESILT